jgi:hypothetical protein
LPVGSCELRVESVDGTVAAVRLAADALVVAGWTGRDRAVLQRHIDELAAIGVAPPRDVPMFYRLDPRLLTTAATLHVAGRESSGEAEAVLIRAGGELLVTVGSDHTDRKLEAVGITLSKQVCGKPIATAAWRWADVADHWDRLVLRSTLPGVGALYQEGAVAGLRRPDELVALFEARHGPFADGTVMFCGTLPAIGGVRFADRFALELADPVLGRAIRHDYAVDALPIAEAQ